MNTRIKLELNYIHEGEDIDRYIKLELDIADLDKYFTNNTYKTFNNLPGYSNYDFTDIVLDALFEEIEYTYDNCTEPVEWTEIYNIQKVDTNNE